MVDIRALFSPILCFVSFTLAWHADVYFSPPTHTLDKRAAAFQADPSIDVVTLQSAVAKGSDVLASYPPNEDSSDEVHIYGDWLNLSGVSAFFFTADMDIDCDGVDYKCPDNTDDGQPVTSWGALDASKVPWIVIPEQFEGVLKSLQPNALSAVICNGVMYYAIFGDENGDTPKEIIGEASLLLGQTCFPNEHITGGTGHDPTDVVYIVFPTEVPSGVGQKTIDISALKTLGDQQAAKLVQALTSGGSGGGSGGGGGTDQCQTDDDCSGSNVCCTYVSIANTCIAQSSCSDGKCMSGGTSGTCDGG